MIGVAGFVASSGDGDAAGGCDKAFGFSEIIAQVSVDRDVYGAIFESLEQAGGEKLGEANPHQG